MWWKTAKPGDEIVCIDEQWISGADGFLRDKHSYIIGALRSATVDYNGCNVIVYVVGNTRGYYINRFRPVQRHNRSTETGMNIIRQIANGERQPAPEDMEA